MIFVLQSMGNMYLVVNAMNDNETYLSKKILSQNRPTLLLNTLVELDLFAFFFDIVYSENDNLKNGFIDECGTIVENRRETEKKEKRTRRRDSPVS